MAKPDDDEALRKKSAALKDALARRRAATGLETATGEAGRASPDSTGAASGISLGMKAASEFIAAVVVGGLMGWGLDRLFGTKPLFIIIFFLLGVAAGVWNVIRMTSPKSAP
jgi:ATP synthase protein I